MLFKNIKQNFESQLPEFLSHRRTHQGLSNLGEFVDGTLGQVNCKSNLERMELLRAAACGNISKVRSKLSIGWNVDARKSVGAQVAGLFGHVFTFRDIVDEPSSNVTPLHFAILNKHAEVAELLIWKGANVNATNEEGYTPLHLAAGTGCMETAELLLMKGANINASSVVGVTPLHLAAEQGHLHLIQYLILEGAMFNRATKEFDFEETQCGDYIRTHYIKNWTPLHFAINGNYFNIVEKMLHIGIALGIDIIRPIELAKADFFPRVVKVLLSLNEPFLDPYKLHLLSELATRKKCSQAVITMINKKLKGRLSTHE